MQPQGVGIIAEDATRIGDFSDDGPGARRRVEDRSAGPIRVLHETDRVASRRIGSVTDLLSQSVEIDDDVIRKASVIAARKIKQIAKWIGIAPAACSGSYQGLPGIIDLTKEE